MYLPRTMIRANAIDLTTPENKVYFTLVGIAHMLFGILLISFAMYLHFFIMHNTCEHCFHASKMKLC